MIAYHILCHDNFAQVARLIDALYSSEDTFLIDIDDGKNPNIRPIAKYLKRENVHITRDAYIGWGGSGTLRKTLQGAMQLLRLNTRWQYYIVLSGQDLPLKKNTSIKQRLAEGSQNAINFIRATEHKELDITTIPRIHDNDERLLWGDRGHTKLYAEPKVINPQFDMFARVLVDVTEVADKGEVYLNNCSPLLLRRRLEFFRRFPLYAGANWFNLHRSLIEYMQDDPFCYELFDVLRGTFIPDECFFQTYIKNSVFRDNVSSDYGRLILRPGPIPKVKVLEMQDWPEIANSNALFSRKFDTRLDKKIVNKVLAERR